MVESPTERAEAVEQVVTAVQAEPETVKQAAVNVLAAAPSDKPLGETADAVTKALDAVKDESVQVKEAAVNAVASSAPIGSPTKVDGLWWAIVIGLLVLLGVTLIGLLWTVLDGNDKTSADKVLIVFTPLLTGLLGLFTPSPRQVSTGGQGR
jgi:hypothetical protein